MAQSIKPEWSNVGIVKSVDKALLDKFDEWKRDLAAHLVATGRIKAPEPGYRIILGLNKIAKDGIVGYAYSPLPKEREPSEKERLMRELEEARLELERMKREATKPRLVKAKA